MDAYINNKDGIRECVNFLVDKDGGLVRSSLNTNAVIVSLFPEIDEDGNTVYKRFVSLSCVDENMLKPLRDEAYRILYGQ